ncbi:MAG: GntR family transcriptional regulator, partial [Aquisalimonadaceae bacterium]
MIEKRKRSKARGMSPDDLVEVLRKRIVSHELPPGSKLREIELTSEFEVSRARIREAFGVLEERGLIERIPNRGAVVTRLEVGQIHELYEVREVLEGLAVRLATEKAPPGSWDDLVEMFGQPAEEAIARNDLECYIDCVIQFRERCAKAADNSVLAAQLDGLYDRTGVLIRRLVLVPGRALEGVRQHQGVLRAMRAGDADLAEELKRKNIRSAAVAFRKYQ